jgi:NodT family efflux transporter outer membrane factor (OMF) lipoprotein
MISLSGCTSFSEYVHNGFKVGPNYCAPKAPVAQHWIDQADIRTDNDPARLCRWWTVLNDPKLNELIACAYRQNLSLKQAGFRVLQARANLAYATGNLFPQQQDAFGDYRRAGSNTTGFTDGWDYGFSLNWELDFWGRFRRAVTAADDQLDASVADYDGVMVTMLGDIAQNYVQVRTDQERIALLNANVILQQKVYDFIKTRLQAGFRQTKLDLDQAESNLKQTAAGIPALEIDMRQSENRLCTLLGMPTVELSNMLGPAPIPTCPPEVVLGMPAQLLGQRPDVRRAERLAAAQAEQIGIKQAALYPAFSINGSLGYAANNFPDLFRSEAFNGSVGPSFQWNLLNYGRIVANVHFEDARFQELATAYQQAVLQANEEVENGLVIFLRSQRRTKLLNESVVAARSAVEIVIVQYEQGAVDFNRYAVIQQNLVTQEDSAAAARGQIAQGLILTYRALGGGWEIRLAGGPESPNPVEPIQTPQPADVAPAVPLPPVEVP